MFAHNPAWYLTQPKQLTQKHHQQQQHHHHQQQQQQHEQEPALAELQHGDELPRLSGRGSQLDQDDDYCRTYAVLVEGLKELLSRLDLQGSSPELQRELQHQTRSAVSGSILLHMATTCGGSAIAD